MNWYRIAKKRLSPQKMKSLHELVQKIISGDRNWTEEELQLQINHPQEIEDLLMEAYNALV